MKEINPIDYVMYYSLVCDDYIKDDEEIQSFSNGLNERIKNLKVNRGKLIYTSPITLVKNTLKLIKCLCVKKGFDNLVNSSILKYTFKSNTFDNTMEYASLRKYNLVRKYAQNNYGIISK